MTPDIRVIMRARAARTEPVFSRRYQAALLQQQQRLYYVSPEGDASLRSAPQAYPRRARGMKWDLEQILVIHGSQQAIARHLGYSGRS